MRIVVINVACLLILLIAELDGLRDVALVGPTHIRQFEDVHLHCNYRLDNDSLYVVKWYRGAQEFYRFVPKEVPPKKFFPVKGLTFAEQYCNDHDILLKNVSLETSGRIKCAVSAEVTFQTFVASLDLIVVEIDYTPPTLEVEQPSYYPGEIVKANCSLERVSHPLNYTWYINGLEVPGALSRSVIFQQQNHSPKGSSNLIISVSILQFEMGGNIQSSLTTGTATPLNADEARLFCKAELFDLYSETSHELLIGNKQPKYSPSNQNTLRRNEGAPKGGLDNEISSLGTRSGGGSVSWRYLMPLFLFTLGATDAVS